MERSLSLGLAYKINIITPLKTLDKAGIWKLSDDLNVLDEIIRNSHTCYLGDREHFHKWGYGCGKCPACHLRETGFSKFISTHKLSSK